MNILRLAIPPTLEAFCWFPRGWANHYYAGKNYLIGLPNIPCNVVVDSRRLPATAWPPHEPYSGKRLPWSIYFETSARPLLRDVAPGTQIRIVETTERQGPPRMAYGVVASAHGGGVSMSFYADLAAEIDVADVEALAGRQLTFRFPRLRGEWVGHLGQRDADPAPGKAAVWICIYNLSRRDGGIGMRGTPFFEGDAFECLDGTRLVCQGRASSWPVGVSHRATGPPVFPDAHPYDGLEDNFQRLMEKYRQGR